jgi:sporulation protein YlmC with PRC-barrel domain
MGIKLLQDDTRPLPEEMNDDYFNALENEINKYFSQYKNNDIPLSYLRNIIKKEIYTSNGYKLGFINDILNIENDINQIYEYISQEENITEITYEILDKTNNNSENDFQITLEKTLKITNYDNVLKYYPYYIKKLENYVKYLMSILPNFNENDTELKNRVQVNNDNTDLNVILDDAVDKQYLQPDRKTLLRGISLNRLLFFFLKEHKKVFFKAEEIQSLFLKPDGKSYNKHYCETALCDINAKVKKQQNHHKYSYSINIY